jgi:hypothetical protein
MTTIDTTASADPAAIKIIALLPSSSIEVSTIEESTESTATESILTRISGSFSNSKPASYS